MAQKIIKIGSSMGVTIPKRLLDKLNLGLSDEVDLEFNPRHQSIEVIPAKTANQNGQSLFLEVKQIIDLNKDEFAKLED